MVQHRPGHQYYIMHGECKICLVFSELSTNLPIQVLAFSRQKASVRLHLIDAKNANSLGFFTVTMHASVLKEHLWLRCPFYLIGTIRYHTFEQAI